MNMHCYWYDRVPNFGDAMTPFLLRELFGIEAVHTPPDKHVDALTYGIGSILNVRHQSYTRATVWGSGLLYPCFDLETPREIAFVRGPLTACILEQQGIACPAYFGDPAVLIARCESVCRPAGKEYACGIVPHHRDHANVVRFLAQRGDDTFHVVDVSGDVETVVAEIARCETVLSSSLHGLIIADALGIPNTWCVFSYFLKGTGFKFFDYYASLGKGRPHAAVVGNYGQMHKARNAATTHDISGLLDTVVRHSPFPLRNPAHSHC